MKKMWINGWVVELDYVPYDEEVLKADLEILMRNQMFNANFDWERYKKEISWKRRQTS